MNDILDRLDRMRRPNLLLSAARIGAEDYRRETHLPRLLGHGTLPRHIPALARLMEIETEMNETRIAENAAYSTMHHVDVMIAVIGEARIVRATRPDLAAQTDAAKLVPSVHPALHH